MELESVQQAYARWSRVYDVVFGRIFARARRRAIELLAIESGARLLEVGVGTGLSLPDFPRGCEVVGIDISRPMLARARARAERVPGIVLVEGDAGRLPFADDTFDGVLAPFVLSAVPDPRAVLGEMKRVCRGDGPFVIVNHFTSRLRPVAGVERMISPGTEKLLGFHAHFPLSPLLDSAGMHVEYAERVAPFHYWQLLLCSAGERSTP